MKCERCNGTGEVAGRILFDMAICPKCGGTGEVDE